jgi:hypothetical protein
MQFENFLLQENDLINELSLDKKSEYPTNYFSFYAFLMLEASRGIIVLSKKLPIKNSFCFSLPIN